jgi:hypothetical protein
MEQKRERYRKAPGRRRGFLFGSSVWIGSDHLLLVKSARFREEYKRFYFRDIQAIVTAATPRFHISTRSALIAFVWLWALAIVSGVQAGSASHLDLTWAWWTVVALLVIVWALISGTRSCRCRIYTAVSAEELPSVYRTWTAQRFIEEVEPLLARTQGRIEGNWAEAVEEKQIGPVPAGRVGLNLPSVPGSQPAPRSAATPVPAPSSKTTRTPIAILFVASLCLGGLADLLTLRASANVGRWVVLGFLLLQLIGTVAVLVESHMGKLVPSLRNLAIVTLVTMGVGYYTSQVGASIGAAYQNAQRKHPRIVALPVSPFGQYPTVRGIAGGMGLLLGLVGAVLVLRDENASPERVSFNV